MLVFISLGPTSTSGMAGTHGISASPESVLSKRVFKNRSVHCRFHVTLNSSLLPQTACFYFSES